MGWQYILIAVLFLSFAGYFLGKKKSVQSTSGDISQLRSQPNYHGFYILLSVILAPIILIFFWYIFEGFFIREMVLNALPQEAIKQSEDLTYGIIKAIAQGVKTVKDPLSLLPEAAVHYNALRESSNLILTILAPALAVALFIRSWKKIGVNFPARDKVEKIIGCVLGVASFIAILTTAGIILSLLFETLRFFNLVPLSEFFFSLEWSPQLAIREDQVGSSGQFGILPLFTGTLLVTLVAMIIAGPIGLMSAIYMSEYATSRFRATVKPLLEILAGIPTVVYGFFAAITVGPFVRDLGATMGFSLSSESALVAGGVMGIMIIPFVSSLSDDVMNAVPNDLRDGSYALGATQSETIKQVVIPAALPGIISSFLLGISRAIGETMIVVMAAGLAANLTANPLESVTTITVQIVTLLVGDQEFDSAKTLAAFALGLFLFVVTLMLNIFALRVVKKYREAYE